MHRYIYSRSAISSVCPLPVSVSRFRIPVPRSPFARSFVGSCRQSDWKTSLLVVCTVERVCVCVCACRPRVGQSIVALLQTGDETGPDAQPIPQYQCRGGKSYPQTLLLAVPHKRVQCPHGQHRQADGAHDKKANIGARERGQI